MKTERYVCDRCGAEIDGNMLLGLPDDDDVVKRAISYLSSIPDVLVEEVTGDVR